MLDDVVGDYGAHSSDIESFGQRRGTGLSLAQRNLDPKLIKLSA